MPHASAHAPGHVLLPVAAPTPRTSPRAHLAPLALSPRSFPPLDLSPSCTEWSPSPQFTATASTELPSPLYFVQRARLDAVDHQDEARANGMPKTSPSSSSSSFAPTIAALRFAASDASPTPLGFSASPL